MKFQFTTLDHQEDAVAAVVRALRDQPSINKTSTQNQEQEQEQEQGKAQAFIIPSTKRLPLQERVTANPFPTDHALLLENIQHIQRDNNLNPSPTLLTTRNDRNNPIPNLTIDMETGTGKTYVYLKTMLELEQHYGYKKFIVITPSIAIREGLLTAIAMTRRHFRETYEPFDSFAYNAKKLAPVRHFAQSQRTQLMILNIQAFVKDLPDKELHEVEPKKRSNIIHRPHDTFEGYSPLHLLRATNPVLILDEPQSIDNTEKAQRAIAKLNPSLILRYSATHKNLYNLLYRLGPVQAYERKLVKQIAVASVVTEDHHNDPTIHLLDVKLTGSTIKARLQFQQQQQQGIKDIKKWVEQGDDLYLLSNEREIYKDYVITNISRRPNDEHVIFDAKGLKLSLGESSGTIAEHIQQKQIIECVEQHFKKMNEAAQCKTPGKTPVKILSLFFIDKVLHYRDPEHPQGLGKFALWFEEAFAACQAKKEYNNLIPHPVRKVHNGYFAQDRKGNAKDSEGNASEQKSAYQLIMKLKEQLLDLKEPLQFIFSHSALREGWDNPNVFQICTLNATVSDQKKRQEIGRGLRLPVDQNGVRLTEHDFNRLTIITNESYETFAKALQEETKDEDGNTIKKPLNAKKATTIRFNKDTFLSQDFLNLWERISPLTRYRIELPEQEIVDNAVKVLREYKAPTPRIVVKEAEIKAEREEGWKFDLTNIGQTKSKLAASFMPELLVNLQRNTSLPRHVLRKILERSECLLEARKNPEAFLRSVSQIVQEAMREFLVKGIRYTKTKKGRYEAKDLFTLEKHDVYRDPDLIYEVKHNRKTLYDHIVCDSQPEIKKAESLDAEDNTKVFVKLPRGFIVRTPIGNYNPDWAIVKKNGEQVDLVTVIETKGSDQESDRRVKENQKISCAEKHFGALDKVFYAIESIKSFQP